MIECSNVDMQDLLPEFVAGELPAGERESVEVHLASCAHCRAEHDVLVAVHNARPLPPVMNIAAIVAALPRPVVQGASEPATPVPFRVITGGQATHVPSMQQSARTRRARPAFFGSSIMKFAAALTLVSVGGLSIVMAGRSPTSLTDAEVPQVAISADSGVVVAALPEPYAPGFVPVQAVVSVAPSVLPIQELSEYTDAELTLLLERLDAWDGAPSLDSVSSVPVTSSSDTAMKEGS